MTRLNRRALIGFAAVAAVYLVAAVATIGTGGHPLRPLYEGIGPSAPYRWVHPPPAFRSTNSAPVAVMESFDLTPTGSQQEPGGSGDGQLALTFPAGAIPPSPGKTSVLLSFAPFDPGKLGAVPVGLFSDGNAYLVTAFYEPGHVPIPAPAKPVDAVIRTPVSSTALLTSIDGRTWTRIPDQHIPTQAAVAATITSFGYLLTVTNVPVVAASSSSGTSIILPIGLGIAALLLLGAAVLWRSDRRRRTD